jgi:hypothetical protein
MEPRRFITVFTRAVLHSRLQTQNYDFIENDAFDFANISITYGLLALFAVPVGLKDLKSHMSVVCWKCVSLLRFSLQMRLGPCCNLQLALNVTAKRGCLPNWPVVLQTARGVRGDRRSSLRGNEEGGGGG